MFNSNDKEKRIKIFEDTIQLCNSDVYLKNAIAETLSKQILYKEKDVLLPDFQKRNSPVKIVVSKKRSFEAGSGYNSKKVCVLNFASATSPGGGVTRGSNAQEECLCRCSTLYPCINDINIRKDFYNRHRYLLSQGQMNTLYNDDCIYTPNVVVFKSDTGTPELLPRKQWYTLDVITCPAPNLRERPSNASNVRSNRESVKISNEKLLELHTKRANRIFDIAATHKADVLILGAFGCGVFQNPPDIVAKGIAKAITQHLYNFDTIEFAVYCSPKDTKNYDVFSREFAK